MNFKIYTAILLGVAACSCSDNAYDPGEAEPAAPVEETAVDKAVAINTNTTFQTIAGFGASDCWNGNWVGSLWTNVRDEAAELLFSQQLVDGQPQGIGLSMWRVNLGAGSHELGDRSGVTTIDRRAESFMTEEGSYDWSKCAGQQFFMRRAKEMGTEKFVLFSNSPLVQYTYNGQARSDRGNRSNLLPRYYGVFADYMAAVARHFVDEGYNITHISPINEPQGSWNGRDQEGSGWTLNESAQLFRELNRALNEQNVSTDILVGECDRWDWFMGDYEWTDGARQLPTHYWEPSDAAYIGDLEHVKPLFCSHSYWTDTAWDYERSIRSGARDMADRYGIELWQSEWCMLGDDIPKEEFPGHAAASDIDRSLHMSKIIHNDLTVAQVTSWCYWVAMDRYFTQYGNRWILIGLNMGGDEGTYAFDGEGTLIPTSNLWTLGNYSLFVRPGYKRVALDTRESRNFFGSAYISPDGKRLVAVYTNMGNKPVRIDATIAGKGNPTAVSTYTTAADKNLAGETITAGADIYLDARSVTTVVYDF